MTILSLYLLVPELKYDACVYSVLCKPWTLFKIATSTKHAKQTEKINSHCRFYGTLCLSFIKVKIHLRQIVVVVVLIEGEGMRETLSRAV